MHATLWKQRGFETTYLPVDPYGRVSPDDVEAAITPKTILMSFMYANNEVGTINPVTDIAAVAAKHGVLFHSDAVQGIGQLPSNMEMLGVDLASLTAHKIYGPKGNWRALPPPERLSATFAFPRRWAGSRGSTGYFERRRDCRLRCGM